MNLPSPTGKIKFYVVCGSGELVVACKRFVSPLIPGDFPEDRGDYVDILARCWRWMGGRMKNHRSRPLLNLAHKLHSCLCGNYSMEGLEPAHSNHQRHGKGIGEKAGDNWHAAMCHECHTFYDSGKASREEKELMFQRYYEWTWNQYFANGWIKVDGGRHGERA